MGMQHLMLLFPSRFHTQFLQHCQFQFNYICYVLLFRSLTDGNCFYSAISVRLVGSNFLIHLLRILTSFELFPNHEFYSKYPVLTDVYNNGKTVLGENYFAPSNQSLN